MSSGPVPVKESVVKDHHADSGAGLAALSLKHHAEPRPGPREVLLGCEPMR
jgi:hypothetical protein